MRLVEVESLVVEDVVFRVGWYVVPVGWYSVFLVAGSCDPEA